MADMIPVHKPVVQGDNETFKELEQRKAAGTLGTSNVNPAAPVDLPEFEEKSDAELEKLTKADLIEYMRAKTAYDQAVAERLRQDDVARAQLSAIHKIPMGKRGETLPLSENNPDHPGRGIPYALHDEQGNVRVTPDTAKRKGGPVTRQDN